VVTSEAGTQGEIAGLRDVWMALWLVGGLQIAELGGLQKVGSLL
jgi:hypothetical protein